MLERQQRSDDTDWQTPEKGVISYNRPYEDGEQDGVEGFVAWYNKHSRRQAARTSTPRRKPEPEVELTEAQKELMALHILREKHWAEHQAAQGANGIDLP